MGPSRPAFQGDSSSLEPIRKVTYDFQLVIRIVPIWAYLVPLPRLTISVENAKFPGEYNVPSNGLSSEFFLTPVGLRQTAGNGGKSLTVCSRLDTIP